MVTQSPYDRATKFSLSEGTIQPTGTYTILLECRNCDEGCGIWEWRGEGEEPCKVYTSGSVVDEQTLTCEDIAIQCNEPISQTGCLLITDGFYCYESLNCCRRELSDVGYQQVASNGCHLGIAWIELLCA